MFTRRITNKDGSFGGVVVVSLDPDYLSQFYQTIDIGHQGTITLIGTDGIIRVYDGPATQHGKSVLGEKLPRVFGGAGAGHYDGVDKLDGVDRMYTYRKVKGYPLDQRYSPDMVQPPKTELATPPMPPPKCLPRPKGSW